jgi:RloB-like protein
VKTDRTRLIRRGGGQRDARLFVIAAEGSVTEKQYFEGLREHQVIDPRRVRVEVIDAEDGTRSAPQHVLSRLDDFRQRFQLDAALDQLWLVIDMDHWSAPSHRPNLTLMIQEALQKGYFVAVGNPCFELWLLLHFTDHVSEIRVDQEPRASCGRCIERRRQICGSYDKSKLPVERYTREGVAAAIDRARALDVAPGDRWPQSAGTHIYRLAQELMQQSRRNAFPPHDAG